MLCYEPVYGVDIRVARGANNGLDVALSYDRDVYADCDRLRLSQSVDVDY